MKKNFILFATFFSLSSVFLTSCSDDDDVDAPDYTPAPSTVISSNFDPEFAAKLQEAGVVKNANAITYGEVMNVISLNVAGNPLVADGKLESLQGVQYFTALQTLECQNNAISELDVSFNDDLVTLKCDNNKIQALDMTGCDDLEYLYAGKNELVSADLRGLPEIKVADLSDNNLTSVNVQGCGKMTTLYINGNRLTSADIATCTSLTAFGCDDNPGSEGSFMVKAWFEDGSQPANFTTAPWAYSGNPVQVYYYK